MCIRVWSYEPLCSNLPVESQTVILVLMTSLTNDQSEDQFACDYIAFMS